jgi:hypothetical protein
MLSASTNMISSHCGKMWPLFSLLLLYRDGVVQSDTTRELGVGT